MSKTVTIHEFTTTHKENITVEFAPTPGQLQRAEQFKCEWARSRYEITVDESVGPSDLRAYLEAHHKLPRHDDQGDPIYYQLWRVAEATLLDAVPTRPLLVLWFDSIGHRLNYPKDELQEGDHLILAPGVHAGGADPWTIGASIAGIAQLILLVIDMWSKYKKNSEPDTLNAANTVLRPQETLKEARILLDNGQWVLLSGGRAVPENIRDLLNGFILPGSTAKPRKALFVLANGERVVLEASSDTDIDNVVRFFRLLGIPNAELSAARCGNRTAEPPNLA